MIVQPAKMSGIVTAQERPNTASRTRSAIGSAIISSPCRRSCLKTGSRSCWIAAGPVTYTCATPGGRPSARSTRGV